MKKLIKHFRRWNIWRKLSRNGKFYKILVLFGLRKSPTVATVLLPEEADEFFDLFIKSLTSTIK